MQQKSLLLLFGYFVLGIVATITEVALMDCDGGFHMHEPGTAFFDDGVDLSILKRAAHAAMKIIHDRVQCKCPGITDAQLESSFTPNIGALFDAAAGTTPNDIPGCPSDILQLDKLLNDIIGNYTMLDSMPDTCTQATWQQGGCRFKIHIPHSMDDNFWLYFSMNKCPGSTIWPRVSISTSGDFMAYLGKPCALDTDCGQTQLTCSSVGTETCLNDPSCTDETEEGIEAMLQMAGIYDSETQTCQPWLSGDTIAEGFEKQAMTFILNNVYGTPGSFTGSMKLCGFEQISDTLSGETLSDRHRQVLQRFSQSFSQLTTQFEVPQVFKPMTQYLTSKISMVKNLVYGEDSNTWPKNPLPQNPFKSRSLLQEPEDELEDEPGSWDGVLDGLMNMLPNTSDVTSIMESWDGVQDDVITGQFYPGEDVVNRVNMFRLACTEPPTMNLMGGVGKRLRFYFMNFPKVFNKVSQMIRDLVNCREQLRSLSFDQFHARFIPFDPLFWMKHFTDTSGIDFGATDNIGDLSSRAQELLLDQYNVTCTDIAGDTYWQTMSAEDDDRARLCEECDPSSTCAFEFQPFDFNMVLPDTCNAATFMRTGECAFVYDNLRTLLDADVKLAFDLKRCEVNPNWFSISLDCVGTDCKTILDPLTIPCSSDSDCAASNQVCQHIPSDMCDPFGSLWGAYDQNEDGSCIGNTNEDGSCSLTNVDGSCISNTDVCTSQEAFQKSLVQAMQTVNGVQNPDATHTGMCTPPEEDIDMENNVWFEEMMTETEGPDGSKFITFANLNNYEGSVWNRDDDATPGPDGQFPDDDSSGKLFLNYFVLVSSLSLMWLL